MDMPFVRSAFNYDRDSGSIESGLLCEDKSLTKQSFAAECDINTIVKNFGLTGKLPDDVRAPTYSDFEGIFDFHSAMNAIATAGEAFDAMDASIRSRFHNDPGAFVDFCSDPSNLPEMRKLGLALPEVAATLTASPIDAGGAPEGGGAAPGDGGSAPI